jgi:hypothetical protein
MEDFRFLQQWIWKLSHSDVCSLLDQFKRFGGNCRHNLQDVLNLHGITFSEDGILQTTDIWRRQKKCHLQYLVRWMNTHVSAKWRYALSSSPLDCSWPKEVTILVTKQRAARDLPFLYLQFMMPEPLPTIGGRFSCNQDTIHITGSDLKLSMPSTAYLVWK